MEVIVRNLDQFADLIAVFFERLTLRALQTGAQYSALLAWLLYSNAATGADSPTPIVQAPTPQIVLATLGD